MAVLAFDPGLTLWTLVTFACLLAVLSRFAFKPLGKLLRDREDRIRQSLDDAEQARREARDLLARNEEQLRQARDETRRIIGEGHKIVAGMKHEAQAQARAEAERVVAQARAEIDREVQRSLGDLKATVANLSVRIARQVIRDRIDERQHEQLADEFIERLGKSHAGHDQ